MNTSNFARFLTVLYNATYLDVKNSEWALSTLSKAKYNRGITNSLPKEITVAHKYGVATSGQTNMLSESAIIYPNGDPYIIVVMTKGTAFDKQAGFISDLSAMVYGSLSN